MKRLYLGVSVAANLGILFFFKYYGLFAGTLEGLSTSLYAHPVELPRFDFLLPMGISFYTFQTMSYALEVFRGRQKPIRHLGKFALYVSFFPQLVAGPIERPGNLLPQFERHSKFDYDRIVSGLRLMGWGLFKKMVIADRLSLVVDHVYATPVGAAGPALILATVFFAFQIYCDFSGYTDIAMGGARVLGLDLMNTVRSPYLATSLVDFWKRWHISLTSWFRDYLYFPLGGNRVRDIRVYLNIFLVFLISGLWHGASYTFVMWGAAHGVLFCLSRITAPMRLVFAQKLGTWRNCRLLIPVRILVTFCLVTLGWVFFRAATLDDALYIFSHLNTPMPEGGFFPTDGARLLGTISFRGLLIDLGLIGVLVMVDILQEYWEATAQWTNLPFLIRWMLYYAMVFGVLIFGVFSEKPFIYFQF